MTANFPLPQQLTPWWYANCGDALSLVVKAKWLWNNGHMNGRKGFHFKCFNKEEADEVSGCMDALLPRVPYKITYISSFTAGDRQ